MLLRVLVLGLVALGCRGPVTPTVPPGDPERAMAELRFRIASAPDDVAAHLGLARLAAEHAAPGAALRHYDIVARNRALADRDRRALGRLLAARGRERVALGDGGARQDLVRARDLAGPSAVDPALWREAHALAALATLRRGGDGAAELLSVLSEGDARAAAAAPDAAPLEALGQAALWAWNGGARRAALALFDRYVERGGDAPAVLAGFARARYWWRGAAGLGYLERSRLIERGVELCSIAGAPDERGCAEVLPSLLQAPATRRAIELRARRLHWPLPRPPAVQELPPASPRDAGLAAIERDFRLDAALADRRAQAYVDGAHAVATRGVPVARLFARLGDPARALAWWDSIAEASPEHAPYLVERALAVARARDPSRALLHGDEAAAASGDGGAVYLALATALLDSDAPVEAMGAARSAVSLTADTEQVDALAIAVVATHRLGRPREHARARAAYLARIDPRYRAEAEAWLDQLTTPADGSRR